MKKYEYCIKPAKNTSRENHVGHYMKASHDIQMPRWHFCGDGYLPESPIRIVGRQIISMPPDYQGHIQPITHDVDTLYVIVSEEEGGLEVEVEIGDETYNVTSPGTALLPKNVPHRFAPKKGHGFVLVIIDMSCQENHADHTVVFDGSKNQ